MYIIQNLSKKTMHSDFYTVAHWRDKYRQLEIIYNYQKFAQRYDI